MRIRVCVFFGGDSAEHEVSIVSALQAIQNMDTEKYEVIPVYLARDGFFYTGDKLFDLHNFVEMKTLLPACTRVSVAKKGNHGALLYDRKRVFGSQVYKEFDVAFPVVHGTNVEDGTVQGFLHLLGIPYVGSDTTASAVGMDKYITKCVLKANKIPVLDSYRYTDAEEVHDICNDIETKLSYPIIVKPLNLGSSIGISIAHNRTELEFNIEAAFHYASIVLVERAVTKLREINCAVLGDYEKCEASECEEPVASDEILDYKQKYLSDEGSKTSGTMQNLKRKLPADISAEERDRIRNMAMASFKALGLSGVVRIDFIIDGDSGELFVNEVNTIPGSLSFYLWDTPTIGLKYKDLLTKLITLALKRQRKEKSLTFAFDTNIIKKAAEGKSMGKK